MLIQGPNIDKRSKYCYNIKMELPPSEHESVDPQLVIVDAAAARDEILELWVDPSLRYLARDPRGEVDVEHLAHIVSDVVAGRRFDAACVQNPNMSEDHPLFQQWLRVREARDEFEYSNRQWR